MAAKGVGSDRTFRGEPSLKTVPIRPFLGLLTNFATGPFVKASGLRWISLMLLAPIPWAARIWALPFLTALAPSERYCRERHKRHKKLTDWARQMVLQARRWMPERDLVLVADTGFAALELLAALARRGVICIPRLRLDAVLYEPAPPRRPGMKGRPRTKGARLPNLSEVLVVPTTCWQRVTVPGWSGEGARVVEFCSATAVWCHSGRPVVPIRWVLLRDPRGRFDPQALLCTDPAQDSLQIIRWFVLRWQIEVTFQEARVHLGVETQRQWSDRAIARTTPCLLGLFSIVTLLARATRTARTSRCSDGQLVSQTSPDLHRCARRSAAPHLAGNGFAHIPVPT
jgi:hypothetical protein